jgi:hypothetical protein
MPGIEPGASHHSKTRKSEFEVGVHHAPHPSRPFSGIYECMGWDFLHCGHNFVIYCM